MPLDENKVLVTTMTPDGDNSPSLCYLKDNYLFGVDLTDDSGEPYPDSFFDASIKNAMARVEREINVRLSPVIVADEMHDYYISDYMNWAYIHLYEYPTYHGLRDQFFLCRYQLALQPCRHPSFEYNP